MIEFSRQQFIILTKKLVLRLGMNLTYLFLMLHPRFFDVFRKYRIVTVGADGLS